MLRNTAPRQESKSTTADTLRIHSRQFRFHSRQFRLGSRLLACASGGLLLTRLKLEPRFSLDNIKFLTRHLLLPLDTLGLRLSGFCRVKTVSDNHYQSIAISIVLSLGISLSLSL